MRCSGSTYSHDHFSPVQKRVFGAFIQGWQRERGPAPLGNDLFNYANFGKKLRPLISSQTFWLGPPAQVGVEPSGGGEGEPDRKPDVFRDAILNPYGHMPNVREHGLLGETPGGVHADGPRCYQRPAN